LRGAADLITEIGQHLGRGDSPALRWIARFCQDARQQALSRRIQVFARASPKCRFRALAVTSHDALWKVTGLRRPYLNYSTRLAIARHPPSDQELHGRPRVAWQHLVNLVR